MSQENVEALRLAYEVAYAQRSMENVRGAFAENCVFHMRPEWPGTASYGIDEIEQMWAELDHTYTEFSLIPEDYAPVGDYVVITVRQSARLRGSDARVDATLYHVWHVRDGKPDEAWAYSTHEEALEAVGLRE